MTTSPDAVKKRLINSDAINALLRTSEDRRSRLEFLARRITNVRSVKLYLEAGLEKRDGAKAWTDNRSIHITSDPIPMFIDDFKTRRGFDLFAQKALDIHESAHVLWSDLDIYKNVLTSLGDQNLVKTTMKVHEVIEDGRIEKMALKHIRGSRIVKTLRRNFSVEHRGQTIHTPIIQVMSWMYDQYIYRNRELPPVDYSGVQPVIDEIKPLCDKSFRETDYLQSIIDQSEIAKILNKHYGTYPDSMEDLLIFIICTALREGGLKLLPFDLDQDDWDFNSEPTFGVTEENHGIKIETDGEIKDLDSKINDMVEQELIDKNKPQHNRTPEWNNVKDRITAIGTTLGDVLKDKLIHRKRTAWLSGQTRGKLDSKRLFLDDSRNDIYRTRSAESKKLNYRFIVLLDRSGSMSGSINKAEDSVMTFLVACDVAGIPTNVISYGNKTLVEKRIRDDITTAARNITCRMVWGGTPLHEALELSKIYLTTKNEIPVIVSIGDGAPDNLEAVQEIMETIKSPNIFIGVGMEDDNIARMQTCFKTVIKINSIDELPAIFRALILEI